MKDNNAIIITGANGNIGSFFAKNLAAENKNLILILRKNDDRLKELLKSSNKRIFPVYSDLSDYDHLQEKLDEMFESNGLIPTVLIHTAAIRSSEFGPLADADRQEWYKVIDVNIKGCFNILKLIIPKFREHKYGKVVLFGSNVTRIGLAEGSAYAASKAGIANICRSIAIEEATHNILVNTISPGPIKIDDSHFSENYRKFRQQYYQETLKEIPLRRYATFDDIYGLCRFLASKENSYITGEEFFVTGGKL